KKPSAPRLRVRSRGRRYPNEYTDTANPRIARVRVNQADSGSSRTVQGNSVTSGRLQAARVGCARAQPAAAARSRLPSTAKANATTRAEAGRCFHVPNPVASPETAPARKASNAATRNPFGKPINP